MVTSQQWRIRKQKIFAVIIAGLAILLPILSFLASSASPSGITVIDTGMFGESSTDFEDNSVAIYVQMLGFDPETRRAELAYYPWPTDDMAQQFSSSIISERDIRVFVDSQNTAIVEFEKGSQVGAVFATVDVLSSEFPEAASDALYPFDRYVLDSFARVELKREGQEVFEPVQTYDYFYSSPVPGYDVTYQRLAAFDSGYVADDNSFDLARIDQERFEGKISFYAFIERSFAVRLIAVFIYLFISVSTLSLVWVTSQMVSGKREPSMQALIWAAASMLGILQLRALAPGEPRIGIYADLIVFFPSLMMSLFSVAVITFLWGTRNQSDEDSVT